MLVLSRKAQEAIQAGTVTITVLEIRGDKVKLGIDAPDEVRIVRDDAKVREPKVQVQ